MSGFLVAPSILSADFANLEKEIKAIEAAGADWVHVDVMDGHFVPNLTIGAPVVKSLKPITRLPLDCHLMIQHPERFVEDFAKAGAATLTIHIETTPDPRALLRRIRDLGVRPGLTLRPATPLSSVLPYLSEVELVLVMTVDPGFSGQKFMSDQVAKIRSVREELRRMKSKALIEVDGGVNAQTVHECLDADVLVAGHHVFKSDDYARAISELKHAKK